MLFIIALCATYRLFTKDWQMETDRPGLMQFLGLLAALALIATMSAGPSAVSK
jgi:hypothetical protein